ncbi:YjfB family protein [Thioalkalivibrio sp. ALRh]|uniref:YjfB family protein n=1 Tax=Thioalkalivibrio sp. ALRh TaxID=1266911 RepID=UPI0003689B5A|nr:YjfB family protein [Thioalkalivibrio sp. ALRh]
MDASAIASQATQMSQQNIAAQKDVAVQKKAMESEEMAAQGLLQAMPNISEMQATSQGLPDHVGNSVDTTA